MRPIQLTALKGQTKEMVQQYLEALGPVFYTVNIPKTSTVNDSVCSIYNDFMMADHFSNRLRQISYDVMFTVPEPAEAGEFTFIAVTEDLDELAGLLAMYANGFEDSRPGMDLLDIIIEETDDMTEQTRIIPYFYNVCARICCPNPDYSMNAYAFDGTY